MKRAEIEREEQRVMREIERRQQEGTDEKGEKLQIEAVDETPRGRQHYDEAEDERPREIAMKDVGKERGGEWDEEKLKGKEAAPAETPRRKRSRWDETPAGVPSSSAAPGETPKRSRWDQTPVGVAATPNVAALQQQYGQTPVAISTVSAGTAGEGFLLVGGVMDRRVRWLTDEELDAALPAEGYEIVEPPAGYAPIRTPSRKLQETPLGNNGGFMMPETGMTAEALGISTELPTDIAGVGDLQFFKKEDAQYFAKVRLIFLSLPFSPVLTSLLQILTNEDESALTVEELKERKIMRLLLKIKNGTPPMRKTALRQITDKAREFGAGPLFDKILPLLMERTLEDQERHLLVKVIDRVLYKLDDLVRPYVHKILVVIEPLLIDEDYYARVEGREIISNLSKAAGLAHMISTMRPGASFLASPSSHAFLLTLSPHTQTSTTPTSTFATPPPAPSPLLPPLSAFPPSSPSSAPSVVPKSRGKLVTPVSRSFSRLRS
jgi:splicing factor 3B subunit 1